MKRRKRGFKNPNTSTEKAKRRATSTLQANALPASTSKPTRTETPPAQPPGQTTPLPGGPPVSAVDSALPSRSDRRRAHDFSLVALWVLAVLAVLALLGGVAWFYLDMQDRTNALIVPDGVALNGVSLAGKDRAQVTEWVKGVIADDFATEIVLHVGEHTVDLSVGDYTQSDPETLVDQIMQVRLDTPLLDRLAHDYLDQAIEAEFETSYLIDSEAIGALAQDVADRYSYDAVDSRIYFEGFTPHISDSEQGFLVDAERTAELIEKAIRDNLEGVQKTDVYASAEITIPEILREDLAIPVLTVNIGARQVLLWNGDKLFLTYPCAVGQPAYPTIPGEYYIGAKEVNPTWINPAPDGWGKGAPKMIPGPNDALGLRGMHIYTLEGYDTQMLFHGALAGGLAGTATTHGCIRMFNSDVIDLYDRVPVGTLVSLSY